METLIGGDGFQWHRFSCHCYDKDHILDLKLECTDDNRVMEVALDMNVQYSDLKDRLRMAWNALLGKKVNVGEFIVRPDDWYVMGDMMARPLSNTTIHKTWTEGSY